MALFPFPQPGTSIRGIRLLFEKSLMSVLSDYSETAPTNLGGTLWELMKAGFKIRDLARETDPDRRGVLIYKAEGEGVTPIAFIATPRKLYGGGCAIDVCRFDRGNRIDTFKIKPISPWN
jgi:hypothetical protein